MSIFSFRWKKREREDVSPDYRRFLAYFENRGVYHKEKDPFFQDFKKKVQANLSRSR
jgi:hypothetical protein